MAESSRFTIHMIGHGHIDPTWLWRWMEGYEEVRATFRSALDRMHETPEFKFTSSSACFYAWVKACDPSMFEEIRARVREGRWDVAGGWWVEPDCNIPGGESIARHGLYSQRFFESEFGKRAVVGFNPDSFGHAGTFPQLYSKMGIGYYVYMRPNPYDEMKYPNGTTFWWEAKDGSRVLACCIPISYNTHEREMASRLESYPKFPHLNPGQTHILGFYGVGNHGGGPTKRAIEAIIAARAVEGAPNIHFSRLDEYFDGIQSEIPASAFPVVDTDLQHHARGCYSVHSEIKRLNRSAEHALMGAERFATAAWLIEKHPFPRERIETAWKDLLYNQFHDILAGSSIEISYEDSRDQIGGALHTAREIANESIQAIARRIDTSTDGNTMVVVNPLPWPVTQTVKAGFIVWRDLTPPLHVVDEDGEITPVQPVRGERIGHTDYLLTAEIPALGYRCFHVRSEKKSARLRGVLEAGRDFLENDWWRIEFDPYHGHISRLYDKKNQVETLSKGNVLVALVDQSDTWSHGYEEWRVEAGRFGEATLEHSGIGEVQASVRVVSRFGKSTAEQVIAIHREHDTIDCQFRVNWQESYTMLKVAWESRIQDGQAVCDTAYGYQERNTQGFEEPCQKWFDLSGAVDGKPYGFSVLNDSKYGYDIRDGVLRLTALRSPAYAHHDRGRFDASEGWPIMDQGWRRFRVRLVPHAAGWREAGVVRKSWELNEPAFVHVESGHVGDLPQRASMLESDMENIALTVLKRSEDGEDIIIRGYEVHGEEARGVIRLPLEGREFPVTFRPHEIKTIRISATGAVDVDLLEEPFVEGHS